MEIVLIEDGEPTVFALDGRLDTTTSPQLEEYVSGLYDRGVDKMVVDMAKCEYVSSAGLRVIVAMQKHAMAGGSLVFRNVVPEVMDVFEMTGFNKLLTFE
ncbi:MAG: STAS domain-containing protein [Coriobacteriales bacterium]|jgi:anti-anti-sigma factor